MSEDLRLYFFECGSLKTRSNFIKMNQGCGDRYEIPVPFFLITHPRYRQRALRWGERLEVAAGRPRSLGRGGGRPTTTVMTRTTSWSNQVAGMDVDPASVRYVIQSHLHSTPGRHRPLPKPIRRPAAGDRVRLHARLVPEAAYISKDFDRDVRWLYLDGEHETGTTSSGDGTIKTLFTPGTRPDTSPFCRLPARAELMLTADACYTMDHYNEAALPGLIHSAAGRSRTPPARSAPRRGPRRDPRDRPRPRGVAQVQEGPDLYPDAHRSPSLEGPGPRHSSAGTMGIGVAECFAAAGVMVCLADATPELAREAGRSSSPGRRGHAAPACFRRRRSVGRRGSRRRSAGGGRGRRDLCFEAVPESVGLKEEVLGVCSAPRSRSVMSPTTSSLPMAELARFVEGPDGSAGCNGSTAGGGRPGWR